MKKTGRRKFKTYLNLFILFFIFFNLTNLSKAEMATSSCYKVYNELVKNFETIHPDEINAFSGKGYQFDIEYAWNNEEEKWHIKRSKKKNIYVSKILNYEKMKELKIDDEIIEINNKKVSSLTNEQIEDLVYTENKNEKLKIKFLSKSEDKIIEKEISQFDSDSFRFDVTLKINHISNIDIKDNSFVANLNYEIIVESSNLYPVLKKYWFNEENDKWGDTTSCIYYDDEVNDMQLFIPDALSLTNVLEEDKNLQTKYISISSPGIYSDWREMKEKVAYISFMKEGVFKIANDYKLNAFPFDKQFLNFKFSFWGQPINLTKEGNPGYQISSDAYSERYLKEFLQKGKILEWNLKGYETKNYIQSDPNYGISDGINFVVTLEREYKYYIFKIILPMILILAVCWSVFWINPKEIESKLTITIVCLLSLIAYNFVIDEDLPKLGYLTVMDYMVLLSYIYATIPNFISIVSFRFWEQKKMKLCLKVDKYCRIFGLSSYVLLILMIVLSQSGGQHSAAFLSFSR